MPTAVALFVAFLVGASLLFTGLVVWMGLRREHQSQATELELRQRVLDKFSSSEEFARFLEGASGRRFFETSGKQEKPIAGKILGSITSGLVLVMLGLGFAAVTWVTGDIDALYPAFISGAIGMGLLISAAISYRLSRAWRLLEHGANDGSQGSAPPSA